MLSAVVTPINARAVAEARGIEVVESRSSRARDFPSLLSVKLRTSEGELWVEGAIFEHGGPRLVLLDGVEIEAGLEGTLIVIRNLDQPGVIGVVGTILGERRINIASFALGRGPSGAVSVVSVDARTDDDGVSDTVLDALRAVPAISAANVVRI